VAAALALSVDVRSRCRARSDATRPTSSRARPSGRPRWSWPQTAPPGSRSSCLCRSSPPIP